MNHANINGRATFSERAAAGSETLALPFSAWYRRGNMARIWVNERENNENS
jgi:hypothetical protein